MKKTTEQNNPSTKDIDQLETLDALQLINAEDKRVAVAVKEALPRIASVVDGVYERLSCGGRLFYVGTGTSGRLGVLDASELPPTFGVPNDLVTGVIAGGYDALYKASEASEDDKSAGASDLNTARVSSGDAVIGIAASGSTPYTIGALEFAKSLGCFTACITCNEDTLLSKSVDVAIEAIVGPEVIAGSTRMKSGTAQKMILNMISTAVMIKLGYVKGNKMTHVKATNEKLVERSIGLLMEETGVSREEAERLIASGRSLADLIKEFGG